MALAVAPSNAADNLRHDRVEGQRAFRSDDGGQNWKRLDSSQYVIWRPFYFANLIVDPANENKLFKQLVLRLLLSVNGGTNVLGMPTAIPESNAAQVSIGSAEPARGEVLGFATKSRK